MPLVAGHVDGNLSMLGLNAGLLLGNDSCRVAPAVALHLYVVDILFHILVDHQTAILVDDGIWRAVYLACLIVEYKGVLGVE